MLCCGGRAATATELPHKSFLRLLAAWVEDDSRKAALLERRSTPFRFRYRLDRGRRQLTGSVVSIHQQYHYGFSIFLSLLQPQSRR